MHLLNRSNRTDAGRTISVGISALLIVGAVASAGCYHTVLVAGAPTDAMLAKDSASKAPPKMPPKCAGYYLLVENALPRAVEIYEVGHMSDRLVAYAQIGYTEVPMTESSQQFIAMSRGEVMAAATNSDQRAGDRVALSRSCRPF